MPKVLSDIKVKLDEDLEEKLGYLEPNWGHYNILRKSIDARKDPHFIYSLEVFKKNEKELKEELKLEQISSDRKISPPLIIGSGPAGLFAALRLVERGIPCHIFEQGSVTQKRIIKITRHWRHGEFDPKDNVCYGEGGAGLFSDGKLITRIKSPHIPYILNRLVQFGAPQEIEYLANPHVGSDRIRRLIPKVREHIIKLGGQFYFNTKVTSLLFKNNSVVGLKTEDGTEHRSNHIILACGHSSKDMYKYLHKNNVALMGKSFAMGLRIEHPQEHLNQIQYGEFAKHPKLGSANYKITHHDKKSNIGVYSFCMCPGGYILSSGTDAQGIVCNGMSNYKRNAPFANAAIVVSIDHKKNFGDDLFGGLKLQSQLEAEAYQQVQKRDGQQALPGQNLMDFIDQKESHKLGPLSSPSGAVPARLDQLLPSFIQQPMVQALHKFEQKMKGFVIDKAQLFGIESRTSSPLRIPRKVDTLESTSHSGLYPAGEGAGYAGGITSAACDGIRIAESIFENLLSHSKTI